jgi:succinylglutamate desuccinylase
MRRCGGYAVTLECGQHQDPAAPQVAYRAIRQAVALLGLADLPDFAPAPAASSFERLRLQTVIEREHEDDRFVRAWTSFDALRAGEVIAERADGTPVRAQHDGRIVFPDPAARPGYEWFYLAVPSDRALG